MGFAITYPDISRLIGLILLPASQIKATENPTREVLTT